jgi:hypothetical protein
MARIGGKQMGQAMCGFVGKIIDFEKLTDKQREALKKELEQRRRFLQGRVKELNRTIKAFGRKSRRAKR